MSAEVGARGATIASGPRGPGAGRVVIETTALARPGAGRGLGRYTREVLDSAARLGLHASVLSMGDRSPGRLTELLDLARRTATVSTQAMNLFHATHVFGVAITPRCPSVASILDVAPLELTAYRRTGLKNGLFYRLAARADSVLTLSDSSAGRITDRLGVPPERIFVAPLPPRPEFRLPPLGDLGGDDGLSAAVAGPYVIALADLGTHDPRKRTGWLPGIAAALATTGHRLVVAGPGTQHLRAPNVVGVGRVADADLARLYRQARAFVSTTAYEGQGLPPLEAMATGTPVVAMANTSVEDVVGDAGVLVEEDQDPIAAAAGPHTASDDGCRRLAAACAALVEDTERLAELASRCRRAAARFSPDRFDTQLRAAYAAARQRRG